jgi:hypothetical protein
MSLLKETAAWLFVPAARIEQTRRAMDLVWGKRSIKAGDGLG